MQKAPEAVTDLRASSTAEDKRELSMLLRVFSRRCGEAASDHIQQADQDSSILEPMPRHPCQSRIGLWRDKSLAKEVLTSDYRIFYFYTCVGAMKFPFVRNDCLRVSCFYAIIKQYIAIQGSLLHNPSLFHFSSPRGKLKGGAREDCWRSQR